MRNRLAVLFQILLTIGLGWALFRKVDAAMVWEYVVTVPWAHIVALLFMSTAQTMAVVVRMKLISGALGFPCSWSSLVHAVFIGAFVGQTPLTNIGGDVVRVWSITREGVPLGTATGLVITDRLLGLLALLLLILFTQFWLLPELEDPWMKLITAVVPLGAVGALIAVWGAGRDAERAQQFLKLPFLARLSSQFAATLNAPQCGAASIGVGLAVNLLSVAMIFTLFQGIDPAVTLWDCLILVPFPLLLSLFPISIGGWGVRESSLVVAFGFANVLPEKTLSVSILFGLAVLVVSLPGAVFLLLSTRDRVMAPQDRPN